MFDFLDSDAFIIGLEILFLTFIGYDAYKYYKTKRREYILNIVMAIGFAIWVLYPFYTKYYEWSDTDRDALSTVCLNEHNSTYCSCIDNAIVKAYTKEEFALQDKNGTGFLEFLKDTEEECFGNSWF